MRPARGPSEKVLDSVMQQTPGAMRVDLYEYRGALTLLVDVTCCDHWITAYTIDGKRLGAPSGGITGHGDGLLSDWDANARFIRTLRDQSSTL